MKVEVDIEYIKSRLEYAPGTGAFVWAGRRKNQVKTGSIAGTINPHGYVRINILGRIHQAHRLAFLLMTGEMPEFVDHINGIRHDNRWENLRAATKVQNCLNSSIRSDNTSGVKGVSWCKTRKKWVGYIKAPGAGVVKKYFYDLIGAELWVKAKRKEHHGEFANHG